MAARTYHGIEVGMNKTRPMRVYNMINRPHIGAGGSSVDRVKFPAKLLRTANALWGGIHRSTYHI